MINNTIDSVTNYSNVYKLMISKEVRYVTLYEFTFCLRISSHLINRALQLFVKIFSNVSIKISVTLQRKIFLGFFLDVRIVGAVFSVAFL